MYCVYRKSVLIIGLILFLFVVCIMLILWNEVNWLYSGMMNDFFWIIVLFIIFVIVGIVFFLFNKSFG